MLEKAGGVTDSRSIATRLGIDEMDAGTACEALDPAYIQGKAHKSFGGGVFLYVVTGLTERGRRATGLWPDETAAADALLELLNQAADTTTDEDDAGNLRKAGRLLRGVPSAVIADVTAALIRQQTGL